MSFNPFKEKPKKIESVIMSWNDIFVKPYNKNEVSPYTKTRIILMNGTEFESTWCKHHFNRHYPDNNARRAVAFLRRSEQQQQKLISLLKPIDETLLETTIGYEQLAVDLTAFLAKRSTNKTVKQALDFALLEDFDHLYRYANLLEMDMGIHAERLVGGYTELMPARPTIAHHRHPCDTIRPSINNKVEDIITKLDVAIITAAEQQTMNYYMNIAQFYKTQKGRELYAEIGMVEEDHVTHYGSLIDTKATIFETLLMHEYTECYLYYSMLNDESDEHVKKVWEMLLEQEIAHLHTAVELLNQYENKSWEEVIPGGDFPELLSLHENKDYVRKVLATTVTLTGKGEGYADVSELDDDYKFFKYQKQVNAKPEEERGHVIICDHIEKYGEDYRVQDKEHPIKCLRSRKEDNFTLGVKPTDC
jgi:rubrerythrin